jgi:hypothetical protein
MDFKNLTFENLMSDAENFSVSVTDSYIEVYPEFLEYFKSINLIEKQHLIISSHFVYGWMPTIIHLKTDPSLISQVLFFLNAAKFGQILKIEELEIIKPCINNSMVGLSKLLHFINPRDYAIWDSWIFKYLTGYNSQFELGKAENYHSYLQKLTEITQHKDYADLHCMIEGQLKYQITPMRAIELLMFETERKREKLTV